MTTEDRCLLLDDDLELQITGVNRLIARRRGVRFKLEYKERRNHQALLVAHDKAASQALGLKDYFGSDKSSGYGIIPEDLPSRHRL